MTNTITHRAATYALGSVVISSLLLAGVAFAADPTVTGSINVNAPQHMFGFGRGDNSMKHDDMRLPGIFGKVTAVDGTTLTVNGRGGMGIGMNKNQATTTYAVDASNALIYKDKATSTLSSVAVGDLVRIDGTISGTNVTAKIIRDGILMNKVSDRWNGSKDKTPIITGNGQPVVGGTVTAVDGSTLRVTNKSNVTYTVDAGSATIVKNHATSSLSNIAVNDQVIVQGSVNGTNVTANSVMDSGVAGSHDANGVIGKMMGGMGHFFRSLFGF